MSDADTAARVLGPERRSWDVVNLNNPFARDLLYPAGAIRDLPQDRFSGEYGRLLPRLDDLYRWTRSRDGRDIVGICQRFGPFNLVIDEDSVARETAESEGFLLADDPANAGRYGVLEYDDFNIFHLCFAAGLDPFGALSAAQLDAFEGKARQWFAGAALVTADHIEMNRALADGTIGFYLSGGMYTASPARREGLRRIRAVTPRSGPVDGKGGIVFLEVTSVVDHGGDATPALAFLEHVLTPENRAGSGLHARLLQPDHADGRSPNLRPVHAGPARHPPVGEPGRGRRALRAVPDPASARRAAAPSSKREGRGPPARRRRHPPS